MPLKSAERPLLPPPPREFRQEWCTALHDQAHEDWRGYKLKLLGVVGALIIAGMIRDPEIFWGIPCFVPIIAFMMYIWYLAGSRNPRPDQRLLKEGIEVHAKCDPNQLSNIQGTSREYMQYEYGDGDDYYCGRIETKQLEKSLSYRDQDGSQHLVLIVHPKHTWVHFVVPKEASPIPHSQKR